jgi:hypothetical protein
LGLAFLIAGLAAFLYSWSDGANPLPVMGTPERMESLMLEANLIMGFCFGFFHLVYGVIVMRISKEEDGGSGDGES